VAVGLDAHGEIGLWWGFTIGRFFVGRLPGMRETAESRERRAAYIAATIAAAPPPTAEQVARVCAVLRTAPRNPSCVARATYESIAS
jgi:hypothetical protein